MTEFLHEVLLDGVLDTLKVVPFLFLAFFLMEYIEHRMMPSTERLIRRVGRLGPLLGGALGMVPQCGFSAAAANLYAGRILSIGTLVAVFLSTSDEMLPLLLSGGISLGRAAVLVGLKALVGIGVGFLMDACFRRFAPICVHDLCEQEGCHCEDGVLRSALRHTLRIALFVLLVTLLIGALVFFIGEDALRTVLYDRPVLTHLLAVLVGFVPSCAASVALTKLYIEGFLTAGVLLSGLLPGAGVGVLVLLRVNPRRRENLTVIGVLALTGFVIGLLTDLSGFSAWLTAALP